MSKKRIAILGSTGSIGTQALDIVRTYPDKYSVEVLTAGKNSLQLMIAIFPATGNMQKKIKFGERELFYFVSFWH